MTYKLDGTTIICRHELACMDKTYTSSLRFSDDVTAKLVFDDLVKKQDNSIKEFAQNQYTKGYRDGRAKRAKSNWFPTRLSFRHTDIKY